MTGLSLQESFRLALRLTAPGRYRSYSGSVPLSAIAAKPTNQRLRIGCAMPQEIFIIRLASINGVLPECYEIHTEPIASNVLLARSRPELQF